MIDDTERRSRLGRRQGLAAPVDGVKAAAATVVCLHATEPASLYLSAFARSRAPREQIGRALYDERTVVKQLAMRRTVFAFPRELLPAVWGSAAARVAAQQRTRLVKDVEANAISADGRRWISRASAGIRTVLDEGPATTAQLRAQVPGLDRRIEVSPGKSYGGEFPIASRVLTALAASGEINRGDNDGDWRLSRPRWTRTDQWLGEPVVALPEQEGYAELVAAWLSRFGPGTEDDLVWWLGSTKAAVRRALADVGAVQVRVASGPAYVLADDLDPIDPPEPWAALLPALDPTTMGWKQRDFYLGEHATKLFDRNGNAGPTAWWAGRVVGGWRQGADGVVEVVPCESLRVPARDALEDCAARLSEWLAGDVVNTIYQSPLVRALS